MPLVLEVGKSYRLKNGWKVTVIDQDSVDLFIAETYKEDGTRHGRSSYKRDGLFWGAEDMEDYKYHIDSEWFETEPGRKGYDGWDLDDWRRAINNSGLFT